MPSLRHSLAAALALPLSLGLVAPAHAGLISVDFGWVAFPGTYSGTENAATAASTAFGAANVWNALNIGVGNVNSATNPLWNGLLDSTGVATTVGVSITGQVAAYSFDGSNGGDALRDDYLYFNNGAGASTSIAFTISGLQANTTYRFFGYGSAADHDRSFDMLLDTDADGSFTDEAAQLVGTLGDGLHSRDAYFVSVISDAGGNIHGQGIARGAVGRVNEANWGGFQLVEAEPPPTQGTVPEPSTLMLCLPAMMAAGGLGHRMRRR